MIDAGHDYPNSVGGAPLRVAIIQNDDVEFLLTQRMLEKMTRQTISITRSNSFDTGLALLTAQTFDVALVGYLLGPCRGVDLVRALGGRNSPTPFIMLSGVADRWIDLEAMEAGVMDFLDMTALSLDHLERTIRYVRHVSQTLTGLRKASEAAKPAASAGPTGEMAASQGRKPSQNGNFVGHELLTPRENEVMAHIARGASSKMAALQLGVSPRTIDIHRGHIMRKLNARNAADLVRITLGNERVG